MVTHTDPPRIGESDDTDWDAEEFSPRVTVEEIKARVRRAIEARTGEDLAVFESTLDLSSIQMRRSGSLLRELTESFTNFKRHLIRAPERHWAHPIRLLLRRSTSTVAPPIAASSVIELTDAPLAIAGIASSASPSTSWLEKARRTKRTLRRFLGRVYRYLRARIVSPQREINRELERALDKMINTIRRVEHESARSFQRVEHALRVVSRQMLEQREQINRATTKDQGPHLSIDRDHMAPLGKVA